MFDIGGKPAKASTLPSSYSRNRQLEAFKILRDIEPINFERIRLPPSTNRPGTTISSIPDSEKSSRSIKPGASGPILAFAIILGLALSTEDDLDMTSQLNEIEILDSVARGTVTKVLDAALPNSSTDLFAAALGESIGGILGAACGALISFLGAKTVIGAKTRKDSSPLITEAIADSDFFIASSAALPLLQAAGLPRPLASLASVVLATIPSELVKLNSREKKRRFKEDELMLQLLFEEEQTRKKERKSFFERLRFGNSPRPKSVVEQTDLIPVSEPSIDFVDVFSDATRWLAFGVLKADFGMPIMWDGLLLDVSLTGALFGIVAAISSQLYADVLYFVGYGPESRQQTILSREPIDWLAVYSARAASTAALFGVYEYSQGPISQYVQGTLAGGVEGCIGSSSFNACLQTYIDSNAPGPSPEAQFRALATNLVMLGERLQDIAGDTSWDDINALVAAWSVSVNSYLPHALVQ